MNDSRLTPGNFDKKIRNTLRYGHGFGYEDLERAKGIVSDAIEHVERKTNTSSGMGAHHLDIAMKYLKEDPAGKVEWKKVPEHQRAHIEDALKEYFDIKEPEEEKAA